MVYVDKLRLCVPTKRWRYGSSCHLFADTEAELHVFARELGLRREWFQPPSWLPHYDLTAGMRVLAVERGARDGGNEVKRRCLRYRGTRMEKQGVVRAGLTPCDICSKTSDVVIVNGQALCDEHQRLAKQASAGTPLKSASPTLTDKHEIK